MDVWNQVLELNEANVNDTTNELMESLSFDSRTSQTRTKSIKVVESNSIQYEVFTEARACQPPNQPIASKIFLNAYFVEETTGMGMADFANKMSVYPNPNTGQFSVKLDGIEASGELYLMDVSGKPLMNFNVEAGNELIELNSLDLQTGFYLVVYENQQGRMTRKIMVEN